MRKSDTAACRYPLDAVRSRPSNLTDRRNQWLEALGKGAAVRDRFQLRDKIAIVRLRPSDITVKQALELEMDRFVRSVDEMSYQIQGISLPSPLEVEPRPGNDRHTFYGGAFLLVPGVPDPPDDDTWGLGPGSLKDALPGPRT